MTEIQLEHDCVPDWKAATRISSFFEFWPSWLIYLPVVAQWLWLSVKYRDAGLPLVANPTIPLAGMVGESKSGILDLAGERAKSVIAPWIVVQAMRHADPDYVVEQALGAMRSAGFTFPVVAKPDQGCRGAGVWKIETIDRLKEYIRAFPAGARLILQRLSAYPAEAGIFYVRRPDEAQGSIISLTLKFPQMLIGDGQSTLRDLITRNARASIQKDVFFRRHADRLDHVVERGTKVQLAFAGNHCQGSLFRNGNAHITPAMTAAFDEVLKDVEGFHFGRLDVRFQALESLQRGEAFEIIEINGAASESTHIWDPDTNFSDAYRALFLQYRLLFEIGAHMRRKGFRAPGVGALLKAWIQDRRLARQYPLTD